jgi:hypothetical protein
MMMIIIIIIVVVVVRTDGRTDGRTILPLHSVSEKFRGVKQSFGAVEDYQGQMIDRILWSRVRQTSRCVALFVLVICCITLIAGTISGLISALPNQMQWTRLMVRRN